MDKTIRDLLQDNETLYKRVKVLTQVAAIYRTALTDLKHQDIAKKALSEARVLLLENVSEKK